MAGRGAKMAGRDCTSRTLEPRGGRSCANAVRAKLAGREGITKMLEPWRGRQYMQACTSLWTDDQGPRGNVRTSVRVFCSCLLYTSPSPRDA
eukprot:7773688-Heterocapsa_arctica.AAC.1